MNIVNPLAPIAVIAEQIKRPIVQSRAPNVTRYLRECERLLIGLSDAERNAQLEREIEHWQARYAKFIREPEPWQAKYPGITAFDFVETIVALSGMQK